MCQLQEAPRRLRLAERGLNGASEWCRLSRSPDLFLKWTFLVLGAAGAPGSESEASPHLTLTDRRPYNAAWSVNAIFVIT